MKSLVDVFPSSYIEIRFCDGAVGGDDGEGSVMFAVSGGWKRTLR